VIKQKTPLYGRILKFLLTAWNLFVVIDKIDFSKNGVE
jgi:hypothetical protein